MQRSDAERAKLELLEPLLGKRSLELGRDRDAPAPVRRVARKPIGLLREPPERHLKHAGRGRVEPLEVVEGDEDAAALGHRRQHVEDCKPDRVRVERLVAGLDEPERDLERAPARRDERRRGFLERLAEEI